METIAEAKQYLRNNWKKGVDCPCCHRLVKLYKRSINSGMVFVLIHVYKITKKENPKDGWIKIQEEFAARLGVSATGMSYSILAWWKLLEPSKENDDPTKKSSGYWRITQKGIDFLEKRITVPKRVHIYDNKCVGFDEEMVDVIKALGKKFDYQELMSDL